MLGGLRHFVWDAGYGMDAPLRDQLAWATLIGGFALTIIVWIIGYAIRLGSVRCPRIRKSLRTPLGRVRFLGSARPGRGDDWLIHVTSVALVPLTHRLRLAAADAACQGLQRRARRRSATRSRRSCHARCSCWPAFSHGTRHALDHRRLRSGPRARLGARGQHLLLPRCWRSPASMRRCASAFT